MAAMARLTQLFAREAAGGRHAAAVHHWPVDTLEDLWLEALSKPGCAEVIDMGHAGSVREERITVETDASARELLHRCEVPTEYPDSTHKWSQCSCFFCFNQISLSPTFPFPNLVTLGSASSLSPANSSGSASSLPIGGSSSISSSQPVETRTRKRT